MIVYGKGKLAVDAYFENAACVPTFPVKRKSDSRTSVSKITIVYGVHEEIARFLKMELPSALVPEGIHVVAVERGYKLPITRPQRAVCFKAMCKKRSETDSARIVGTCADQHKAELLAGDFNEKDPVAEIKVVSASEYFKSVSRRRGAK
jgi:hypothetical protein